MAVMKSVSSQPTTVAVLDHAGSGAAPPSCVHPLLLDSAPPEQLLNLADRIAAGGSSVGLSADAWSRIAAAHRVVTNASASGRTGYGISTGVGGLAAHSIAESLQAEYQSRLLRSHAAGCGSPIPRHLVALMLVLRLRVISRGFSGASPATVQAVVAMLNAGVLPVVPSRGSVGASGDLAPLAHAALPLIGEGQCTVGPDTPPIEGRDALRLLGLAPLTLGAKEALTLMNGTALSTALAIEGFRRSSELLAAAVMTTALFYQGLGARPSAIDVRVADAHAFPGTRHIAHTLRQLLALPARCGREEPGQDPYSLRCAPQVLGSVHDELTAVRASLLQATDCVTDNPIIDPVAAEFLSGGNFHGIAVGRLCDRMALTASNIASLIDRQLAYAIDGRRSGLPDFLTPHPGLNSGFMMHQVTTAALASECRLLAIPAGLDTIPTSNGQEDHVPMAPLSGWRLLEAIDRATEVTDIACLGAIQACRLSRQIPERGPLAELLADGASRIPAIEDDRVLMLDLSHMRSILRDHASRSAISLMLAVS